jgi:hypothetical protein
MDGWPSMLHDGMPLTGCQSRHGMNSPLSGTYSSQHVIQLLTNSRSHIARHRPRSPIILSPPTFTSCQIAIAHIVRPDSPSPCYMSISPVVRIFHFLVHLLLDNRISHRLLHIMLPIATRTVYTYLSPSGSAYHTYSFVSLHFTSLTCLE